MFSLFTLVLVLQTILHQPIWCKFEELAAASAVPSGNQPLKYLEDVDTTLSLCPGSSGKRYQVDRNFVPGNNRNDIWLKLNVRNRRDPQTFEFFPAQPEKSLRDINNSPRMTTLAKNIHHQKERYRMGVNEDVVLSLGRAPPHQSLRGFKRPPPDIGFSGYVPADKIHIKLEPDQGSDVEKEAKRPPLHMLLNNIELKEPKIETVSIEEGPQVINQWNPFKGIESEHGKNRNGQYKNLEAHQTSRFPENEQDHPQISDQVSTTDC